MAGRSVRRVFAYSFAVLVGAVSTMLAQSVAVGTGSAMASRIGTVTISVDRVTLESALQLISRQAGLKPSYSVAVTNNPARITLHVRNVPATDAFTQALRGTGLQAVIEAGRVVFTESATPVSMAQGSIVGKVVDANTNRPLRNATVTLDGATKGVQTWDDGTFRFHNVAVGSHTVSVRLLGYVKATKTATVVDGQVISVDVALEPSVNALDQVVVTGTIAATELKAIPNAITVITAKDIAARGITRIDQLFRGDVPGVFAWSPRSDASLDEVVMFSRGTTALTGYSPGTVWSTNPIKTYVDGVELANPSYLSQLDPQSIERIEILTGPQASTIYGSNAINGVMQVFTKRGTTSRAQLTVSLLSGFVQNDFRSALTPQHDDAVSVSGTDGRWSYNAGGSWNYIGAWTPGKQTSRTSGFGGIRLQRGAVSTDASLRLGITRNRERGQTDARWSAYREIGWYVPSSANGRAAAPREQTLNGQTFGLTLGYAPVSWWTHQLVLGQDRSAPDSRYTERGYLTPKDTLLSLYLNTYTRTSWRYATTVQRGLADLAKAVVTAGGDGWRELYESVSASAPSLTGTLAGTSTVGRQPGRNAGGFLQVQVSVADQLFLTYGLRAEWNPDFGEDIQPNLAPRYGMSYARDFATPLGEMTTKVRASFGRTTRPPGPTYRDAQSMTAAGLGDLVPYFGDALNQLENPGLGPEFQQGGEGGIELYFGSRGSLVITRYNQTVENLIANTKVDSARSLLTGVPGGYYSNLGTDGYAYWYQYEYLNIGSIRNQGWEAQGTLALGPLTTKGTYSWTKSRVMGVTPKYRSVLTLPVYQPGTSFKHLQEHTWALGVTYAKAQTTVAFNLTGTGMSQNSVNKQYFDHLTSNIRLSANRMSMISATGYPMLNAGTVFADLNATHRFSSSVEGVFQVQDLGDTYPGEESAAIATMGRQTKLGVRLHF